MTQKQLSSSSQTALILNLINVDGKYILRSPEAIPGNDSAHDPAWMYHVATSGPDTVPPASQPSNENFCKPKWHKAKKQLLLI